MSGLPNPTFSQTVGSITTRPQSCKWCHKQYASKAKLLQHQRKKHPDQMATDVQGKDANMGNKVAQQGQSDSIMKQEYQKVEVEDVENIITDEIDDYAIEDDSQYCHLSINESNGSFIEAGELENPGSQLYRLLTTNNGEFLFFSLSKYQKTEQNKFVFSEYLFFLMFLKLLLIFQQLFFSIMLRLLY